MKSINEYKDRFFHLLETEIGDVKPIINEQPLFKTEIIFRNDDDTFSTESIF